MAAPLRVEVPAPVPTRPRLVLVPGGGRPAPPSRARRWGSALAALFVLAGLGGAAARVVASPSAARPAAVVVVSPGDTLWDLAVAHAPAGIDPRAYLEEVKHHNQLTGSVIQAGQRLVLP